MELVLEEFSIAEQFEKDIPDDSSVVCVKLNEVGEDDLFGYATVKKYIEDECKCEVLYASGGLHKMGDNKVPHIHYNFITTPIKRPSNPSQSRQRWLSKNIDGWASGFCWDNYSFKFHQQIDLKECKYNTLAYPLKEGIKVKGRYLYNRIDMSKQQKDFLMDVGKAIYEKQVGLRQRQEKCEERKKVALNDLYDICKNESFESYKQMLQFLDVRYISSLEIEDYPDPRQYKTNCQKIAVKLGLLKYSEL